MTTTPAGVVNSKFNVVESFSETQQNNLTAFIGTLDAYINTIVAPIVEAGEYDWDGIDTTAGAAARPDRPDLTYSLPDNIDPPDLDYGLSERLQDHWRDEPFPENWTEKPVINLPDRPNVTWPSAPSDPAEPSEVHLPTPPEYIDRDAPTIHEAVIGDVPTLPFPSLSVNVPAFNEVDNLRSFEYDLPDEYYSALAELIKAKLENDVENGGTGLGEDIEDAIWARAQDRQQEVNEQKYTEATDYWSARGFALPPGALVGALAQVAQEIARADAQLNYEISIEQAKLADQNTRWAVDSGILFEKHLMDHHDGWAAMSLEAAKVAQQMAIELYRMRVVQYEATLAGINAKIAVFEGQIKANAAILEQYRIKADIIKTNAELQELYVRIWDTYQKANAVRADIYRTEVESARILSAIEAQKLETHKLRIEAYTATVNANTARYGAYAAEIEGETAKIQIYAEQVKAYLAEVEIAKIRKDQMIANSQAEIGVNQAKLEAYKVALLRYEAELKGELSRLEAQTEIYKSDANMYSADLDRQKTALIGDIESYKARMEHERNNLQIALKESELTGAYKLEEYKIKIQALQSKVSLANQLVASALSAINASAQISASMSEQLQQSTSQSYSEKRDLSFVPDTAPTTYLEGAFTTFPDVFDTDF